MLIPMLEPEEEQSSRRPLMLVVWERLPMAEEQVTEEVVEGGRVLVGRRRNCSEGSALSEREASRRSRGHGGRWT